MTQAWAIKGPDGDYMEVYQHAESEKTAWQLWDFRNGEKEKWVADGYTCVPVTIVEGSAEPVLWVHPDALNSAALGVTCSPKKLGPRQMPLYLGPPADESRALLERVFKERSETGYVSLRLCNEIEEFLARSGKHG